MAEKKHTFVICAYKESPYLEACIRSLKKQTVASAICLATSTPSDYLKNICEKYDMAYYIRDGRSNIADDWNFALSVADTEYVTIAHQDDIYEAAYTEEILKIADQKDTEARKTLLLFSDYRELIDDRKYSDRKNLKIKRILLGPLKNGKKQGRRWRKRAVLRFGNAICCPAVTYHKTVICEYLRQEKRVDLFLKHFRSNLDWQTWEWLSEKEGEFVYIPECLMAHRIHEDSETSATIRDHERGQEDFEVFCKFWPKWIARILAGAYGTSEKGNEI